MNAQRTCGLFIPAICLNDAERHLVHIAAHREIPLQPLLRALHAAMRCIEVLEVDFMSMHRTLSLELLRHADGRPVLAAAIALDATIWSEDHDFFGIGVASVVCHNVELWLSHPEFGALSAKMADH